VLAAHIFHRTIEHTGTNDSQDQDFSGHLYWKRHKGIDNDLKFMLLMLPKTLCLPANYRTHNAIFVNVMLETATICLHRAALWRMKSNLQGLPSYLIRLSQDRLLPAAEEILNIFRMIPDLGATFTNPLICFAAYMAALVFMASTSPTELDGEHGQNLDFILKILAAFGNTNLVANALANEIVKEMKQCGISFPTMNKVDINTLSLLHKYLLFMLGQFTRDTTRYPITCYATSVLLSPGFIPLSVLSRHPGRHKFNYFIRLPRQTLLLLQP
jgi:hypothetical protein